jgi:hypothetical protein
MATVYSLVCWGGRAGKTATISNASPCVVTINNHGIRQYNGGTTPMTKGIQFTTTGALPTGLSVNTTYWARYINANTFHLYDTEAHALDTANTTGRKNTSSAGSGTHTAKGAYFLGLTATQLLRYGAAGSERIYASLYAWKDARVNAGVNSFDVEVCEIGEAFTAYLEEIYCSPSVGTVEARITTLVDGVRSSGFHNGVTGAGFIAQNNVTDGWTFYQYGGKSIIDGITIYLSASGCLGTMMYSTYSEINNCIVYGSGASGQNGINNSYPGTTVSNNICHSLTGYGFNMSTYQCDASQIYNNTSCKNGTGFLSGYDYVQGFYFNNVAVGNTTNWGTAPQSIQGAGYNFGAAGNAPWGSPDFVIATTDFLDYNNNNFAPALKSSPQVMEGALLPVDDGYDIIGSLRPSFIDTTRQFAFDGKSGTFVQWERVSWGSSGTAGTGRLTEYSADGSTGTMGIHLLSGAAPTDNLTITGATSSATALVNGSVATTSGIWAQGANVSAGAIEYDFDGPESLVNVTLQNVADGSRYRVYNQSTSTVISTGTQSGTGDITIANIAYSGTNQTLEIDIRKASGSPKYLPFETLATLTATGATVYISQQPDTVAA